MTLRRGFLVWLLIVAGMASIAAWLKPDAATLRESVHALVDANDADAAVNSVQLTMELRVGSGEDRTAPASILRTVEQDWLIARHYSAWTADGQYACWGAMRVTFCISPDEGGAASK